MVTMYNVGNKVEVRKDLIVDSMHSGCWFGLPMKEFAGKTLTIKTVGTDHEQENVIYEVEENNFFWGEEMFKNLTLFTKADLKSGMVVEFKSGKRGLVLDDRIVAEHTCALLSDYDNNLDTDGNVFVISKVFKTTSATISGIFNDNCLELIWEKNLGYNGKVVCVDAGETCCWTVGKIYQFTNGIVVNDLGDRCSKIESFDHLTKASTAKWLEIIK